MCSFTRILRALVAMRIAIQICVCTQVFVTSLNFNTSNVRVIAMIGMCLFFTYIGMCLFSFHLHGQSSISAPLNENCVHAVSQLL